MTINRKDSIQLVDKNTSSHITWSSETQDYLFVLKQHEDNEDKKYWFDYSQLGDIIELYRKQGNYLRTMKNK